MLWLRLRTLIRLQRGAVALEAIISIMLMLGAFYVMWGAALVVYNQSKVASASQFAAQGALVVYDRSTYRGGYPIPGDGTDGLAYQKASEAATSLVSIDGAGMLPDQFGVDTPPQATVSVFAVTCGPSITGTTPFAASACDPSGGSSAATAGAQVTRVAVTTSASSGFWLLAPLSVASSNQKPELTASAIALSAGPNASP
jgi:hypothetical protein